MKIWIKKPDAKEADLDSVLKSGVGEASAARAAHARAEETAVIRAELERLTTRMNAANAVAGAPVDPGPSVRGATRAAAPEPAEPAHDQTDEAIVRAYLDPEFYRARNPDVAAQGADPVDHY